jgi:hypothetical protein
MPRQQSSANPAWVVGTALIAAAWCAPTAVSAAEPPRDPAAHLLRVTVAETAGIRRFGYPVNAVLRFKEPVRDVKRLRLVQSGKPVSAQFRECGDPGGAVRLDFNVSQGPFEVRDYLVEYDRTGEPASPPRTGLRVETTADEFRVVHPSSLQFAVPRNLLGLFRQVRVKDVEYLRPGSAGLMIRYKDEIHFRAGGFGPDGVPTQSRIVKEGPLAVTLRFDSTEALRGGRSVRSAVEMEFPLSKSWVRLTWTVDDPHGYVAGLGADLNLKVEGEPTLVDFGAGSYVYAALHRGESAILRQYAAGERAPDHRALGSWETLVGPSAAPVPYVVGPRPRPGDPLGPLLPEGGKAEGWAHVMDRRRCTAVALANFAAEPGGAMIRVDADGRLQVWKDFARDGRQPPPGPKRFTCWLHFVDMPVHVGAATSPQAMLAPLEITVRPV